MNMFEPLPDIIRLRRKQRNLTQEQLAKMAGVSRRQLSLLEDGANVSLLFLLKVCKALELTDLQIGGLRLHDAPHELGSLIAASEAMDTAQEIVSQFSDLSGQLGEASASINALVERALNVLDPTRAGAEAIEAAAARLEKSPAGPRAIPSPKPASAAKAAAKATTRRRTR
jgi:transcriptional regulator with XRE-family HTH domain